MFKRVLLFAFFVVVAYSGFGSTFQTQSALDHMENMIQNLADQLDEPTGYQASGGTNSNSLGKHQG